ncbi:hypothetical protein PFICI_00395 [Pestalotiopsis fici W106-1]|uniref:Heterokaryon incompatibility domain-containing protein n=1 Tax=Pestalotiopsis fici (strain W106-1 / CGMCC3.15140) TaxID=1229662 RepID=W3XM54_PESFW|nr:uncharacterized protein PFICI_00395 [Pestalotiopsis fici W106-1]ETS86567.1 hypothetical protein PFICI_00395 [Pestalotiopsis fici W106-1]
MSRPKYSALLELASTRQFRLLKLHRGFNEPLSGELIHSTIHQSPPFRALSYTWNTAFEDNDSEKDLPPSVIIVDGIPVSIGQNLATALVALRDWHGGADGFVWNDAICIDQNNYAERAYQVSIMGEIYNAADSVSVWLGTEAQDSDRAIDFLRLLARVHREPKDRRTKTLAMARNPKMEAEWKALDALWKRRWWHRAWVLQETALARRSDFSCGRGLILDSDVYDGTQALRDVWPALREILAVNYDIVLRESTFNAINGITRIRKARLEGTLFNMLTCHFRTTSPRATDPRDYIFAKMGLASNGYLVKPSYSESVEEVYTRFVVDYIEGTRSLDIIHSDGRPRVIPNLPSWVPDWSTHHNAEPIQPELTATQLEPNPSYRPYRASNELLASVVFESPVPVAEGRSTASAGARLAKLKCRGRYFDTVDGVTRVDKEVSYEPYYTYERIVDPAVEPRSNKKSFYASEREVVEAICNSVFSVVNHDGNLWPAGSSNTLISHFANAEALLQHSDEYDDYDGDEDRIDLELLIPGYRCLRDFRIGGRTIADMMCGAASHRRAVMPVRKASHELYHRAGSGFGPHDIDRKFRDSLLYRRWLTTADKGAVGSGPLETRAGDVVVILNGCTIPVILRPEGEEQYSVVGAGFVHGIMYGEAAENKTDERWFALI